MSASASSCLMFSISPAKKQAKKTDKDEEKYILILAPFNKAPKINLGQIKLNELVEKNLLVVNPQDFALKLNIKNTDLHIDNIEVEIERQASVDFKIKWKPEKVDNYKFSIIFEVLNSRLKFIVHAFGVCIEPPKKKVYKNLTVLQPVRPVLKPKPLPQQQPLKKPPVIEAVLIKKEKSPKTPKYDKENKLFDVTMLMTPKLKYEFKEGELLNSNENDQSNNGFDLKRDKSIDFPVLNTPKLKQFDETVTKFEETLEPQNSSDDALRDILLADIKRKYAALKIQKAFKAFKRRKEENIKLQNKKKQVCMSIRVKLAAIRIQRTYRNYKIRKFENMVKLIKQNHAARVIQNNLRKYLDKKKQIKASNIIKHFWHLYKFRKSMKKYRDAAIKIQKWSKSMKERYNYLKFRRLIIYIQQKYKRRYQLRSLAALKIQLYYRSYKLRMYENDRDARLNYAAVLIQSFWRGYKTRKDINLVQLFNIRQRISIYNKPDLTLGFRIKRSLSVLKQKLPSIQQVITALMDLQVVTRLSKECCLQFKNAGAISILYEFITQCNRSTPHMDLVKLCIEILINLSKCEFTFEYIIDFDENNLEAVNSNALNILFGLLQAYQCSNAQIFMNVCVLFIILCSNEKLYSLKSVILQQINLKKLIQLYAKLERRSNFKVKNQRQSVLPTQSQNLNQDFLNETVNSTISIATNCSVLTNTTSTTSTTNNTTTAAATNMFNQANFLFSIDPDWSLKEKIFIQLSEPLGALHYFLVNTLKTKIDVLSDNNNSYKTPKKGISTTVVSNSSSSSSSVKNSKPIETEAKSTKKSNSTAVVRNIVNKPTSSIKSSISSLKLENSKLKTQSLENLKENVESKSSKQLLNKKLATTTNVKTIPIVRKKLI